MAFIFKVTTTAPSENFTIQCQNVGTFNATVDWGDGGATSDITTYNDADLSHTYTSAGTYTISITGTFPNIYMNNSADAPKIVEVVDLGDVGWTRLNFAFYGCTNLTSFASGTTDTSSVPYMYAMFYNCSSLTSLDVSGFNTSAAVNMSNMLRDCSSLTSLDVSGFNTSAAINMSNMFYGCSSLTSLDVSGFNTSAAINMSYMFYNCSSLTSLDVSGFNTPAATNMNGMFRSCSSLTSLDVSGFNTSSVTDMSYMFFNCTVLTGLRIRDWDVSSVTAATSFCQNANNALSTDEYSNVLINWGAQSVQSGVNIHFGDATYTAVGKYAVGIQMQGTMTFADNDLDEEVVFVNWYSDANNKILERVRTNAGTGDYTVQQSASGVADTVSSSGSYYTPGINVSFNIASRHGSTFINGAVDGTALTEDTTPTELPNLSATNLSLGYDFMGTIDEFRMWGGMDIGDTTIAQATA